MYCSHCTQFKTNLSSWLSFVRSCSPTYWTRGILHQTSFWQQMSCSPHKVTWINGFLPLYKHLVGWQATWLWGEETQTLCNSHWPHNRSWLIWSLRLGLRTSLAFLWIKKRKKVKAIHSLAGCERNIGKKPSMTLTGRNMVFAEMAQQLNSSVAIVYT